MSAQIQSLKKKYVAYFADVPIQKYASMHIARDEDTIIRWKHEDANFADAVKMAEAEFIRKKMLNVKAEFALERLFKSAFSQKQEIELSAEPIPVAGRTSKDLREKMVQLVKDHIRSEGATSHQKA